jgi:ketosteroid isomerase-like protein
MKKLIGLALVLCTWTGLALSQDTAAKKPAKGGSSVADTLKQMEHDWTDAQKAGDTTKLDKLIADDWSALGPDGKKMDKKQYLAGFKSGDNKFESIEVGDMDVLVSGNIGIVQGSDTEKSSDKGKDTSGKYVWMDVFEKKSGKWQAVRSEVTKVQE